MHSKWIPILLLFVGLLIVGVTWVLLSKNQERTILASTEQAASLLKNQIAAQLSDQINTLSSVANRWQREGAIKRENWEDDARWHAEHKAGYQAIEWVDSTYKVRWVIPQKGNERAQGLDLKFERRRKQSLDKARLSHTTTIIHSVELLQGGNGILIIIPLFVEGEFDGFILGVFRIKELFDTFLIGFDPGYSVAITDGSHLIYDRDPLAKSSAWQVRRKISLFDAQWDLKVSPSKALIAEQKHYLPQLVLIAGTILTILFALVIHLYQVAWLKNIALRDYGSDLEKQVNKRTADLDDSNQQLNSSTALLDTIFNNLPVGVALLEGAEFRYLRINEELAQLNGLSVAQHLGRPLAEVLPKAQQIILPELQKVRETGKPILNREFSIELPNNQRKKHLIDWHLPIFNRASETKAIVSVVCDVTTLKETQEQLRQSQKLQAIGVLAGGIAHEFNNLLTPMVGFSEVLLQNRVPDDPEWNGLEQIHKAGKRAAILVQQLLAYGRQSLTQSEPVVLQNLIDDTIGLIKSTLPANIAITTKYETNLPAVMGMPNELHQVVLNLCINASQAMAMGGRITIALKNVGFRNIVSHKAQNLAGEFLCLSVKDTGSGMAPEIAKMIFDPFFTTKRVSQGSGLGLSVVEGIVDQHEGHIEVETKAGNGTTFFIYLPIATTKIKPVKEQLRPLPRLHHRVLLIDDDPMVIELIKTMLERLGCKVTDYLNCKTAIEYFATNPDEFDLVITDYEMALMNGKQVANQLKNIRADITVVMLTGYGDLIPKEDYGEWGIEDLLMKPISLQALSNLLTKVQGKKINTLAEAIN